MADTYWFKQTTNEPLFPDLQWSRPETKHSAGKLLIIGGNGHGFAAPAEAYMAAKAAGIGTSRVLMPLAVKKLAGKLLDTVDYAPSNLSGSFSKAAISDFLELSSWSDGVLLPGDLGHNSETAIVFEKFMTSYSGQVTLAKDAADYAIELPKTTLHRPKTLLVVTIAELQKLFVSAREPIAITFDMDLIRLVDRLHEFTKKYPVSLLVKHLDQYIVAASGQVATQHTEPGHEDFWRVQAATKAAVWQLQNPSKTFEAIVSSLIQDKVQ